MKTPSQTRLKEILRESAFDPRGDGPCRVLADIVVANPRYAEDRAIELIREAQASGNPLDYHAAIIKAIGLLALSRAVQEG